MSYYPRQQPPVGVPPPQRYPNNAYPPTGYPVQGYPPPGYPPQQGYNQYPQHPQPQPGCWFSDFIALLCCDCVWKLCSVEDNAANV